MQLNELTRFTDDVEAVSAFYESLPGATEVAAGEGISIVSVGDLTVLVHEEYEAEGDDLPPDDHVSFEVENLDATVADLRNAGLEIARGPETYDWGRSAYLRDPDGRQIEIAEAE
ncbi:Lactoylglutathione lyase-related protein [Salinarchaeum sp. Harcht-Bsk1]|uniref:VOC family protein n=1 Tax=Salinarchaeum sp. Harcht-Bsk1 TaxID=1333523 RepID=UPI0003423365|nr:VOC family protein [Salinarchaeum sp. Harcht-Bsk1]AGN01845.1 Lactoylglutathione lyase-related protein [Salinarchaeum sp. Harcht-Bsk1]